MKLNANKTLSELAAGVRALSNNANRKIVLSSAAGLSAIILLLWLIVALLEREPDFGPLPDFAAIKDVSQMKASFFDYLQPIVAYHNQQIAEQRQRLQKLGKHVQSPGGLSSGEKRKLMELAEQYNAEWNEENPFKTYRALLLKVDEIPMALAVVQAAKESGWGRSRFAKQGNNLFGEWCFKPGCGIVPSNRAAGKQHEVASFDSVSKAVRNYLHNLNSNPSYKELRQIRARLREQGETLNASALASGLTFYSERREAYVEEVRAMIRQFNNFNSQRSRS